MQTGCLGSLAMIFTAIIAVVTVFVAGKKQINL